MNSIRRKWRKYRRSFLLCGLGLCFLVSIRLNLQILNYREEEGCYKDSGTVTNLTYTVIRQHNISHVQYSSRQAIWLNNWLKMSENCVFLVRRTSGLWWTTISAVITRWEWSWSSPVLSRTRWAVGSPVQSGPLAVLWCHDKWLPCTESNIGALMPQRHS